MNIILDLKSPNLAFMLNFGSIRFNQVQFRTGLGCVRLTNKNGLLNFSLNSDLLEIKDGSRDSVPGCTGLL